MNFWINYHHLYYFKTIVEEGSVTKAASKLHLGQSTLSTQLKQFETNLETVLFERKGKSLILTEQGKVAFDYAQQIFKLGSEMYEVLHDQVRPSRLHLQIGALDSIPKSLLTQLTNSALKIQPCQVTIVEGSSDQLLRQLQSHQIDLFVTNFLPNGMTSRGLSHRSLLKENLGLFASSKYKNLKRNFPQSLNNQPFIMPTYDSQMRYAIEHWLKLNNIRVDIVAESQDSSLKKLIAESGVGIMCSSLLAAQQWIDTKSLFQIGEMKDVQEEIFLISAQRNRPHPIATKLMKSFSTHN